MTSNTNTISTDLDRPFSTDPLVPPDVRPMSAPGHAGIHGGHRKGGHGAHGSGGLLEAREVQTLHLGHHLGVDHATRCEDWLDKKIIEAVN